MVALSETPLLQASSMRCTLRYLYGSVNFEHIFTIHIRYACKIARLLVSYRNFTKIRHMERVIICEICVTLAGSL
jgi:hypothetical protein